MTTRKQTSCILEILEKRQLLSVASGPVAYAPTDLSQVAAHYPVHQGTTILYLNFDGGTIKDPQAGPNTIRVDPYVPQNGQTGNQLADGEVIPQDEQTIAITNREEAIQDILYHTAEIFSPFNVRVEQMTGYGNYSTSNGNTTIFIGDTDAVDAQNPNDSKNLGDINISFTPQASLDYPGANGSDYTHIPNSDPYDLAFVDPSGDTYNFMTGKFGIATVVSDLGIARDAAHEAGHTFGLAHVNMPPVAPPPPGAPLTPTDLMSVNTSNNQSFQDVSLQLTNENFGAPTGVYPTVIATGADGSTYPLQIVTQNSYQYLLAALGPRAVGPDPYPFFVADPSTLNGPYQTVFGTPPVTLGPTSVATKVLSSLGEYDAWSYTDVVPRRRFGPPVSVVPALFTRISLTIGNAAGGSAFDPEILLYNSAGTQLLSAVHGSSMTYNLQPNINYKIVVGGFLGNSAGQYTLSFRPAYLLAPPNFF